MAAINQGKNQAPVAIMAGGDTPESVTDAKGKVIVIPTQKDSHSEKKSGTIRIWRSNLTQCLKIPQKVSFWCKFASEASHVLKIYLNFRAKNQYLKKLQFGYFWNKS